MISEYNAASFIKYSVWLGAATVAVWMLIVGFPDEASAFLVVLFAAGIALSLFRHYAEEKEFITTLFLGALVVRLAFGMFVQVSDLVSFFGGDALTFHNQGSVIADYWNGLVDSRDWFYQWSISTTRPGWGMNYIVAGIYYVTGKNMLAAQSFCAVIGASTAPMAYFCAKKLFANNRVARVSALAIAFFPSFIIWSGQLLKDGVVIFLLVVAMTMVLQLQEKFNYAAIITLLVALGGIVTIRFYIFYMVAIAVAGSFIIGVSEKSTSILRRSVILVVLGLSLTYFGVIRTASSDFEKYADLDKIQNSRMDLARSADSGFNEDADVSTTQGAIATIPVGLAYLMLAPFPWQVGSLRQTITLPEVLVWWALIPFMISGIIFSVKHRLRTTFPILFFALTLTLAYSVFQGNVGTAYRQRTQIQVFLFMFIAVGWVLWKEKREDRKAEEKRQRRKFDE
jgi:4-amino-4-deoxy-L-arabinose transferase-like glycosyltransferase